VPHPSSAFKVISTKTDLGSHSPVSDKSIPDSNVVACNKVAKGQKYEKKNIYFKAVFRDIRKYFIEKLKNLVGYKAFESSIKNLILKLFISGESNVSAPKMAELVNVLAPFLNYNYYMISFKEKDEDQANAIRDCLQNFTLTKMRRVLQYDVIKKLVRYYFEETIIDGSSSRFVKHKTM
jgi:hypothetical protein